MKKLQILMPMAGLGSRFIDGGYKTPKPLIKVDGKEMYIKALSSFDSLCCEKRFIFVIQEKHQIEYQLKNNICTSLPEADVITINHNTRGSVETCLEAENKLNMQDPVVVLDCDLWFKSEDYINTIENVMLGKCDDVGGSLLYFESNSERYSYAEIENSLVLRTAEKKPISSHALVGAYFFSSASIFVKAAKELLEKQISKTIKEYYTSLLYNIVIADKHKVTASKIQDYHSFGTPEELTEYGKRH